METANFMDDAEEQNQHNHDKAPKFNTGLILEMFKESWSQNPAKISADALKLSAEYLRLFVIEAHRRANEEAGVEHAEQIEPEHIEKVMLSLLLDF
mmetsp:Transcript_21529/g.31218  ORF Transcript_21529/g.31218 Transcript_21529/m.31218 type:complete len:96 (-) Transcript_21529:55-342(-)